MDGYRAALVWQRVIVLVVLIVLPGPSGVAAEDGPPSDDRAIATLVAQLGSDQYVVRCRAEAAIIGRGLDAFDALKAAENAPDLEVAARARYLARLIHVPWVRPEDPAEIQRVLRGYGGLSRIERAKRIQELTSLAPDVGVLALCRIVRFEASPLLSRTAALAVMESVAARAAVAGADDPVAHLGRVLPDALAKSRRPAACWLRALLVARRDPEAGLRRWQELIRAERQTLANHPDESRRSFILALMRRHVALLQTLGRKDAAVAETLRMVDLEPGDPAALVALLHWLVDVRAWTVIDGVVNRYATRFRGEPRLRYALAEARSVQGDTARGQQLAEEAFRLQTERAEVHYALAVELEGRGLFDWAEREYRFVIQHQPPTVETLLWASNRLSLMLHDLERDRQAADVLQNAVDRMEKLLTKRRPRPAGRAASRGPTPRDPLRARVTYYRAQHEARQKHWMVCRQLLDRAIQYDPTDVDVLIAMYHLPAADKSYHDGVRQRVVRTAAAFRQRIKKSPANPALLNQLAWLIGNTEGDLDAAITASRQSLKVQPASAGYLDTLAHCYFAKHDYARAVQVQSRAAAIEPHSQAIVRELKRFKQALAKSGPVNQKKRSQNKSVQPGAEVLRNLE